MYLLKMGGSSREIEPGDGLVDRDLRKVYRVAEDGSHRRVTDSEEIAAALSVVRSNAAEAAARTFAHAQSIIRRSREIKEFIR